MKTENLVRNFLFRISVSSPRLSVGQKPPLTKSDSPSQLPFRPERDITQRTPDASSGVPEHSYANPFFPARPRVKGRPCEEKFHDYETPQTFFTGKICYRDSTRVLATSTVRKPFISTSFCVARFLTRTLAALWSGISGISRSTE